MIVYVVAGGGHSKIGIAKDMKQRMKALQNGNPSRLRIRFTVEVPDSLARTVEAISHALLGEKTAVRRGEWFRIGWEEAARAVTVAYGEVVTNPGTCVSAPTTEASLVVGANTLI